MPAPLILRPGDLDPDPRLDDDAARPGQVFACTSGYAVCRRSDGALVASQRWSSRDGSACAQRLVSGTGLPEPAKVESSTYNPNAMAMAHGDYNRPLRLQGDHQFQ